MSGEGVDAEVRFTKSNEDGPNAVVLGRHIRTDASAISCYCLSDQKQIFEDLSTLVEAMAYVDRVVLRPLPVRWARSIKIILPVFELSKFKDPKIIDALMRSAGFLTGDDWRFEFVQRVKYPAYRQNFLALPPIGIKHIVPFSDGLDSFAQAKLSSHEFGSRHVMLVRAGLSRKGFLPNVHRIRVPRRFGGAKLRESTYRTRPLVFFTMAAIAAAITGAQAVAIGESGQGAVGPACVPLLGEWPFRSTHPAFISRWNRFINLVLETNVRFVQPQVWKTKGEVLSQLRLNGLHESWELTRSCSGRPVQRLSRNGCGFCGGCLLRSVSASAAGMESPDRDRAFDVFSPSDLGRDLHGNEREMQSTERDVATTAIRDMHEFAQLSSAPHFHRILSSQATLIDSERPEVVIENLVGLQKQHKKEWDDFLATLPRKSWVIDIVKQL